MTTIPAPVDLEALERHLRSTPVALITRDEALSLIERSRKAEGDAERWQANAVVHDDQADSYSKRTWAAESEITRLKAEIDRLREAMKHEDDRQTKLHEILEQLREDVRSIEPGVRPEGMFTRAQNAVYAMRGRVPLLDRPKEWWLALAASEPPDAVIGAGVSTPADRTAPQATKPWKCAACGCQTYARVDERQPLGGFAPGPLVRCVECKEVWPSQAGDAAGGVEPTSLGDALERLPAMEGRLLGGVTRRFSRGRPIAPAPPDPAPEPKAVAPSVAWDKRYPSVFYDTAKDKRWAVAQYQSRDTLTFGMMHEHRRGEWHESELAPQEALQFALAILNKPLVAALATPDRAPAPQTDAVAEERKAIAEYVRYVAGNYPQGSDGRNTFVMTADWIEARSASPQAPALHATAERVFELLGEPEYKLARWAQGAEPWHYWSREAIASALAGALTPPCTRAGA